MLCLKDPQNNIGLLYCTLVRESMNLDGGSLLWFTSTPYTTSISTCTIHTSSLSTQLMNSKCEQVEPAYGTKT